MAKIIELERYGQILKLEVRPGYYPYNRALLVGLYEDWESYGALTCNLDKSLERNCAYIDVNNMGEDLVEVLEKSGFGKRTGRKCRSGFVLYPEFRFNEEALRECTNDNYEQYLAWQDELKEDEEYIGANCRKCYKEFHFIVKKSEAQMYREYQEGARHLIQDVFPNMTPDERGLFAQGQNVCGKCFKKCFHHAPMNKLGNK